MGCREVWIFTFVLVISLEGYLEALGCASPGVLYEPTPGHKICYTYNKTDVKGNEAEASCQYSGAHAVQIYNADVFQFLTNLTKLPASFYLKNEYWVGIKHPPWIWLDKNDSLDLSDKIWSSKRPDMTQIHKRRCVASYKDGWVDADCTDAKEYMCQKAATLAVTPRGMFLAQCDDLTFTLRDQTCFKHHKTRTDFFDAKGKCKEDGQTLARLDTDDKAKKLLNDLNIFSTNPVWMGLYREQWTWLNGDPVEFFAWKDDEPKDWDKECIYAKIDGEEHTWITESCTNKKAQLCEKVVSMPCTPTDLKYTKKRDQRISQADINSYTISTRSIMNCVTTCTQQYGCQCTAVEYSASSGSCTILEGAQIDASTSFVAAPGVDTMIILNGLY